MSAPGEDGRPGRPSVAERGARRETLERAGGSRYGILLRVLRAGSRIPPEVRTGTAFRWHPVLWTAIRFAVLGISLWIAVSVGVRLWREHHVDTWSGPDTSVTSGYRLAGCAAVNGLYDEPYPSWVRFRGSTFGWIDRSWVFSLEGDAADVPSGYRLGDIELYLITGTPEGRAGRAIALRPDGSLIGRLYLLIPGCS